MDQEQLEQAQIEAYRKMLSVMLPGVPLPHTMGEAMPGMPGALPPGQQFVPGRGISPFQRQLNQQMQTRTSPRKPLAEVAGKDAGKQYHASLLKDYGGAPVMQPGATFGATHTAIPGLPMGKRNERSTPQ